MQNKKYKWINKQNKTITKAIWKSVHYRNITEIKITNLNVYIFIYILKTCLTITIIYWSIVAGIVNISACA